MLPHRSLLTIPKDLYMTHLVHYDINQMTDKSTCSECVAIEMTTSAGQKINMRCLTQAVHPLLFNLTCSYSIHTAHTAKYLEQCNRF